MVGWAFTKLVNCFDASSITAMAITTAAIMIGRSFTIPTAVITASRENTASRITICTTTTQNLA